MIFLGQPNLYVRISRKYVVRMTGIKGFYFDNNGEYKTDNEYLCKVLQQHFPVKEEKPEEPKEEKKLPADGFYNCKKCDFKTENKGELMAHYRIAHKKEE